MSRRLRTRHTARIAVCDAMARRAASLVRSCCAVARCVRGEVTAVMRTDGWLVAVEGAGHVEMRDGDAGNGAVGVMVSQEVGWE